MELAGYSSLTPLPRLKSKRPIERVPAGQVLVSVYEARKLRQAFKQGA